MQRNYKWLLLPPALALVLFLGPLRVGSTPTEANTTTTSSTVEPPARTAERPASRVGPQLPDMSQAFAALVGILILGGIALVVIKRMRLRRPIGDGEHCILRQSLHLSQRHVVHAVEFDGEMLLIGENEGNLSVLRSGSAMPTEVDDEESIRRRAFEAEEEDGGAVPRDMVIPRPPADGAAARAKRASAPRSTVGASSSLDANTAAAKLASFKSALTRAAARSTVGAGAER